MTNMEYHFTYMLYILMLCHAKLPKLSLVQALIKKHSTGINKTLLWQSTIACDPLFPARLICVSSSTGINLLTTRFSSPRYCAHISGIGKFIAAGIASAVFSAISKKFKLHDAITRSSGRIFYFFSLMLLLSFSHWLTVMSFTP